MDQGVRQPLDIERDMINSKLSMDYNNFSKYSVGYGIYNHILILHIIRVSYPSHKPV